MHLRWFRCYTTGVWLGGMSQSFDARIEHVPRFGAVKLNEFCCRCQAGWYLVCWLLVVLSGRLLCEPCATRSSLHRPNTSYLLDAAGLFTRTSPMLIASVCGGRSQRPLFLVITDEQLDAKTSAIRAVEQAKNWGVA